MKIYTQIFTVLFTVLLTLLCSTSISYITVFSLPTIANENSPKTNSTFSENTIRLPELKSVSRVKEAKQIFNQAYEKYESGKYPEAENILKKALKKLYTGNYEIFQSPQTQKNSPISDIFATAERKLRFSHRITNLTRCGLDEIYVKILNNLEKGESLLSIPLVNLEGDLESASQLPQDLINLINFCNQNNQPRIFNINDIYNTIEDGYKIEIEMLKLLQRTLVAQNLPQKIDEALEISQLTRNLELIRTLPATIYALNNQVLQGQIIDNKLPKLINPKKLSVNDIKNIARQEKATIVYYSLVSETEVLVWVVQPNEKIDFRKINTSSVNLSLNEAANGALLTASSYVNRGEQGEKLTQAIKNLNLRTNRIGDIDTKTPVTTPDIQKQKLQQLYRILIRPIQDFLPKDEKSHVIFIPQGSLSLLPFHALIDFNGQYLIDKHTIRFAPNLHSLLYRSSSLNNFPKGDEILVIGNPSNSNTKSLPGAEQEAKDIGTLAKTYPLIREQANKKNILERITNAKIIHLATHGLLDLQNLTKDMILLVRQSKKDSSYAHGIFSTYSNNVKSSQVYYNFFFNPDKQEAWHVIRTNGTLPGAIALSDSFLTSQELINFQKKLKAKLVVLSACNTANGIQRESVILGLPFAMGLAGVPRVVVSLWAVPDNPTHDLMVEFYSQMQKQGKQIDEAQALRQAMLQVKNIDKYSDPINWAGFTLMDVSYRAK